MQEPNNIKQKRFNISQDDLLVIFICGLIIFGIAFVWYKNFPLWFNIPLTTVLLFSMYYQIMVWINQTSVSMIPMHIEDRMINESAYQTSKRGYIFKVQTVRGSEGEEHYKIETNMPKWKKKYVKLISIFFVILCPAWNYRLFDTEDEIWVDEE